MLPFASEGVYSNIVAGSVPCPEGDPEKVAYFAASTALGTENVLLHTQLVDGHVFYLAIPAKVLASLPNFSTPLVVAIPGTHGHRGDGCYLWRESNVSTAILKQGVQIELVAGEIDAIQEFVERCNAPVYELNAEDARPLQAVDIRNADFARKTIQSISGVLLWFSVVVAGMAIAMAGATTWLNTKSLDYKREIGMNVRNQVKGLTVAHDLSAKMAEVEKLSSVAARAGGWIVEYHLEKGESKWQLEMPPWISNDYYKSLGDDVKADINRVNNVVILHKGFIK